MGTRAPRKPDKAAVGMLAPMVVGTMNFCVVTTFGAECGISDLEGKLLVPSLQRIMERLPAEAATKAAIFIDPIVVLTVLVMWGKRIASMQREKTRQQYQVAPQEFARANGVSGFTYAVPTDQPSTPTAPADVADPETSVTSNGVPSAIRESFDSQF